MPCTIAPNTLSVVSARKLKTYHKNCNDFAVFFSMRGCGHCESIHPILTEIAVKGANTIPIVELVCNDNSKFVQTQNIEGVPEIRRYSKGKEVLSFGGARTKRRLATFLKVSK